MSSFKSRQGLISLQPVRARARQAWAAPGPAPVRDQAAAGEGEEPGAEADLVARERRQLRRGRQPDILREVVALTGGAGAEKPRENRRVLAVQHLDRPLAAGLRSREN